MDDVFADEPGPTTPTSPPVELADAEQRREARAVEDRAEIELRQRFLEQQRHLARLMEEESDATAVRSCVCVCARARAYRPVVC